VWFSRGRRSGPCLGFSRGRRSLPWPFSRSPAHVQRTQEMGACVSSSEEVEQPSKEVSTRRKASNSPAGSRGSPRRSPHARHNPWDRLQHMAGRLPPSGCGIWKHRVAFCSRAGPLWSRVEGKSYVNLPQMPPDSGGICMGVD